MSTYKFVKSTGKRIKKRGLVFLMAITIIFILGVMGYFIYTNNFTKSHTLIPPTDNSISNTVKIPTWKTFVSKYGKYSIKYPADWKVVSPSNVDPAEIDLPVFVSNENFQNGEIYVHIGISSNPYGPNSKEPSSFINKDDKFSPYFTIDPKDLILNKTSIKLDSKDAVGFDYFQSGYSGGGRWQYVVVSDSNNIRYTISYEEQWKSDEFATPKYWKTKQVFDEMLSTFKFAK